MRVRIESISSSGAVVITVYDSGVFPVSLSFDESSEQPLRVNHHTLISFSPWPGRSKGPGVGLDSLLLFPE